MKHWEFRIHVYFKLTYKSVRTFSRPKLRRLQMRRPRPRPRPVRHRKPARNPMSNCSMNLRPELPTRTPKRTPKQQPKPSPRRHHNRILRPRQAVRRRRVAAGSMRPRPHAVLRPGRRMEPGDRRSRNCMGLAVRTTHRLMGVIGIMAVADLSGNR